MADVTPDIDIAIQEQPGPVLLQIFFVDDAQAIEITKGTEDQSEAGVFTSDVERATRAARAPSAAQVFVKDRYACGVATPFDGSNPAMAARKAAELFGTKYRPRTSRSG